MNTDNHPSSGPVFPVPSALSNRRRFLGRTLAAGGLAAMGPVCGTVSAGGSSRRPGAPVVILTHPVSVDDGPRVRTRDYLGEILNRAGVFFDSLPVVQAERLFRRNPAVAVLAGNPPLSPEQRRTLAGWVRQGGSLMGIGGTSGLDEVFGGGNGVPLAEGWMKVTDAGHPVTDGLRSSLHVFGGCSLKKNAATAVAGVETAHRAACGDAVLEHRFGKGRALLIGPDLVFSIVHIQQGAPVLQDGRAAPDGSAPVNDGLLKAEDGMVLDWERDRSPAEPDGGRIFLEPVADELRGIILRGVFHLACEAGIRVPLLWYWPGDIRAVGLISHDTDGNDPSKAEALLAAMNRCGVKSTWCTLYPGGYPSGFYRRLEEQEFEIALHYDAMSGGEKTSWSRDNFLFQHRWLMKEAGLREIVSNKNHYTRWEGRLDFLRWCEEAGIRSDETRGPSKKGSIGFPLGGSQPYFPLDDEASSPRLIRVLEVNMQTQDPVVTHPPEYGRLLAETVLRHHGVAHFLFHPAHILKPGVNEALDALVRHGRNLGMPWWTNRQIAGWETLRRGVTAAFDADGGVVLRSARTVPQATVLVLRTRTGAPPPVVNGNPVSGKPWNVHGFDFDAVTMDLAGSVRLHGL